MKNRDENKKYYDCFEYHGSTIIEHIRKLGGITVWRDWMVFDSVEEAAEYFNDACCA